jgi:glycosyltransferase involved in cell wall biosynthesis
MALEVPTVAYPESLEGMGFRDGRDYLGAANPKEFAEQIDRVLTDKELADSLSRSARGQVSQHYGFEATYGRFVDLYRELLADERL